MNKTTPLRKWLWSMAPVILAVILLAPTAPSAECFQPTAMWRFEELTPPYLDNVSGQGSLDGACIDVDSCPASVPGLFGSALKFHMNADASSGSGIVIAASAQSDTIFDWSAAQSFSIEFWMKRDPANIVRNEVIIGRDQGNALPDEPEELHWWIGVGGPEGFARAHINARPLGLKSASNASLRGDHNKYLVSKKNICDNAWHHIVLVRDARADEIRLYIDGVIEDRNSVVYADIGGYKAFGSDTANLGVGWMLASQGYHYQGTLDDLALYDLALPAWYIEQRYYVRERVDPCP